MKVQMYFWMVVDTAVSGYEKGNFLNPTILENVPLGKRAHPNRDFWSCHESDFNEKH